MTSAAVFVFLVSLGAALRLTWLATQDAITKPIRQHFLGRYLAANAVAEAHQLAKAVPATAEVDQHTDAMISRASREARFWGALVQLFDCPWCIGFWISAATSLAALQAANFPGPFWFTWPAMALTISWLVGFGQIVVYTAELYEPNGTADED